MNNKLKKILLVDDSQVDRDLSAMVFTEHGYSIQTLDNSGCVLDIIAANMPDIILLDIMMPQLDGNELLSLIRKKWNSVQLPVIMMTSKNHSSDLIESLNRGANDYISKPVEYFVALRRIQTHLEIADLSKKTAKIREMEAMQTIVTTYHHNILNPLCIAIGYFDLFQNKYPNEEHCEKTRIALNKILDITKNLDDLIAKKDIEYEKYSPSRNMVKLTKKS